MKDLNRNTEKGLGKSTKNHTEKIMDLIDQGISQSAAVHQSLLDLHTENLLNLAALDVEGSGIDQNKIELDAIISKSQIQAFGTGLVSDCFGPEFSILDQRKTPRIPNGDLLMIDRIIAIEGERGNLKPPAEITSEYHVPLDAWYLDQNTIPGVPISILMEIALQPCGILSAFLGTSLFLPPELNTFRNLDGELRFISNISPLGKTITNHARLVDSFSSGGMHIQKYAVSLLIESTVFAEVESSFGYFSEKAMQSQKGLGGEITKTNGSHTQNIESQSMVIGSHNLASSHFNFIDSLSYYEKAGKFSNGLIQGSKKLTGMEWFYECHFYQDPVMPGSLGLEAIMQGLWTFLSRSDQFKNIQNPKFEYSQGKSFAWKYRGQVIPKNRLINFELHVKEFHSKREGIALSLDADFWVDGKRIYEFNDISMEIKEGQA